MSATGAVRQLMPTDIAAMKGGAPIVCLTAYTTPMARMMDAHVDLVLVGDSVGMVLHGLPSTLGVTMEMMVLHGQAVARLAPGLRAEAHAPDGVVEAFSAPDAPGFNLCVQWHPEWRAADNPVSMKLFGAFGSALRDWQCTRRCAPPEG